MNKIFLFAITLLISILLIGCGSSNSNNNDDSTQAKGDEQNRSDTANSSQEVEGYIVEIDGDDVLLLEDALSEEFQKVEDKFSADDPSSNFDGSNPTFEGPDDGKFMYIDYKNADVEIDDYEKGDEVKAQIGGDIRESYPLQADGKGISLKD